MCIEPLLFMQFLYFCIDILLWFTVSMGYWTVSSEQWTAWFWMMTRIIIVVASHVRIETVTEWQWHRTTFIIYYLFNHIIGNRNLCKRCWVLRRRFHVIGTLKIDLNDKKIWIDSVKSVVLSRMFTVYFNKYANALDRSFFAYAFGEWTMKFSRKTSSRVIDMIQCIFFLDEHISNVMDPA